MAIVVNVLEQERRDVPPVSGNGGGQPVLIFPPPTPEQVMAKWSQSPEKASKQDRFA